LISASRATRRLLTAVLIAVLAAASLLFAAPAQAYDIPAFEVPTAAQAPAPYMSRAVDAAGVVELWKTAGPATRTAAATALTGGADALQAFLDAGQHATLAVDRKELVTELTTRGSEHVRSKAKKILAADNPALIDEFLAAGWESTWNVDLRITATRFLNYTGPIRMAASKSLDQGPEAVEKFVLEGWRKTAQGLDREAVTYLTNSPVTGVTLGAQAALDTYDPDALATFLRYGQFVAAAQDQKLTTVTTLLHSVQADIAANPVGAAAVAERSRAALDSARSAVDGPKQADLRRLLVERDYRFSLAWPKQTADNARLASQEQAKAVFKTAASEIPDLLSALTAPEADLDTQIQKARQATLDLSLVGTPEVRKAAEAALLGGDAAIKDFVTTGHDAASNLDGAAFTKDRQRSFQHMGTGGEQVQKAAKDALKSANHADVRYFLEYGHADAQYLDNTALANRLIRLDSPELQTAAGVAMAGGRAELQAFASSEQFTAAEKDAANAEHAAAVDAAVAQLSKLTDQAVLDAAKAAEAARQEAARQAAAQQAAAAAGQAGQAAAGQVDVSQQSGTGVAPVVVPWPRDYAPAVGLAETGTPAEAATSPAATPSPMPSISVPPLEAANGDATSVDTQSQEAATPLAASSAGMSGWTIGLIAALVLAGAGAITFLLRRKGRASA